jgi:hypothetical protein
MDNGTYGNVEVDVGREMTVILIPVLWKAARTASPTLPAAPMMTSDLIAAIV